MQNNYRFNETRENAVLHDRFQRFKLSLFFKKTYLSNLLVFFPDLKRSRIGCFHYFYLLMFNCIVVHVCLNLEEVSDMQRGRKLWYYIM